MKPKVIISILIFNLVGCFSVFAQDNSENLILNSGFENYSNVPLGWFYSGDDFSEVMQYWNSPTAASPDIYGPKILVPKKWRQKGFGEVSPHQGKSMVGITVFGCQEGKPHCREYIQIQLTEPLVIGQRYDASLWMNVLPNAIQVGDLQMLFTNDPIHLLIDEVISVDGEKCSLRLPSFNKGWQKVRQEFTAKTTATYVIFGNFKNDPKSTITSFGSLKYAYYYLDDISIYKLPPIIDVPVASDDLSRLKLEEGKTFTLKNLYFNLDKAEFLPRSYKELYTLFGLMQAHPYMQIEVKGHADNSGTKKHNQTLSISRAKAVVDFLVKKGISTDRLSYKGYGDEMPVASNSNEAGRKENRRVEFKVLRY